MSYTSVAYPISPRNSYRREAHACKLDSNAKRRSDFHAFLEVSQTRVTRTPLEVSGTGSARMVSAIGVSIEDVRSILNFRIGFSL